LFPYQCGLVRSRKREVVTLSAPQIGKTVGVGCWQLAFAWEHPGSLSWWAAPTFEQTDPGYYTLKDLATSAGVIVSAKEHHPRRLMLLNGSRIVFKSWDEPQNLSGPTLHSLVMDEAHELTAEAYRILTARLSATYGPIRAIGNAGSVEDYFKVLCDLASDPANADIMDFVRWTWRDKLAALRVLNPAAVESYTMEMDSQRRKLSDVVFRCTYEAEWRESSDAVFDKVQERTVLSPCNRGERGVRYVIGWDIARSADYTVGVPVPTGQPVSDVRHLVRFHKIGYPELVERIEAYSARFNNALNVIETNGPGQAVLDNLQHRGKCNAIGHVTTNKWKNQAVNAAAGDIQWDRMRFAPLPPLQSELMSYRLKSTPGGVSTYSAPAGKHDDCVMGLVIGNHYAQQYQGPAVIMAGEEEYADGLA
jgi:hypothetical protein